MCYATPLLFDHPERRVGKIGNSHAFSLCYWSAPDPGHAFHVTPLVQTLWRELEPVVSREID